MSFLRFQIRHPNGQVEHLNVDGERVMIGSGAHCEIRLPVDQAALESVLVQQTARSEERRVGKECSVTCRSRWSPYH